MDQNLLFFINKEWTNAFLDSFMAILSSFAVWQIPLLILLLVVFWKGGFRARAMVLCIGILVGISDGGICKPLKKMINRPRPDQILSGVRMIDVQKAKPRFLAVFKAPKIKSSRPKPGPISEGRSMPSSHTVDTICAATIIALFYRRRGWLALIPALLVAYSRVYVGSHWPSDILTSIFLGVGIALLGIAVLDLCWRRWGKQFFPKTFAAHPALLAH